MREPLDSRKHKDSGRDFESIYEKWYDPIERRRRRIEKMRKEREDYNKNDVGL